MLYITMSYLNVYKEWLVYHYVSLRSFILQYHLHFLGHKCKCCITFTLTRMSIPSKLPRFFFYFALELAWVNGVGKRDKSWWNSCVTSLFSRAVPITKGEWSLLEHEGGNFNWTRIWCIFLPHPSNPIIMSVAVGVKKMNQTLVSSLFSKERCIGGKMFNGRYVEETWQLHVRGCQ